MPIMGRITVNGIAVQFGTKVEIRPEYWNVRAGKAIGKGNEVQHVNSILESIKVTMTNIYRDLREKENEVTPEKIKNIFFGVDNKHQMFLDLFIHHNENKKMLIGNGITKATYLRYEYTRKILSNFIKERFNLSDISLKEINHSFITDFEVYLMTNTSSNSNTIAKFMQRFRSILIIGWIQVEKIK